MISFEETVIPNGPTETPPGFKITKGTKVTLSFQPPNNYAPIGIRFQDSGSYFKLGIREEVYQWLTDNVGEYCKSHHRWEEGQGDWTYSGANPRGSISANGLSIFDRPWLVTIWLRDHRKALLFKLTWAGRL